MSNKTTFRTSNSGKPAPKWFRKLKSGVCMILIPAAITMLQSFGLDDNISTKLQMFLAVGVVAIFEFFQTMLSNGEEYAKSREKKSINTSDINENNKP